MGVHRPPTVLRNKQVRNQYSEAAIKTKDAPGLNLRNSPTHAHTGHAWPQRSHNNGRNKKTCNKTNKKQPSTSIAIPNHILDVLPLFAWSTITFEMLLPPMVWSTLTLEMLLSPMVWSTFT